MDHFRSVEQNAFVAAFEEMRGFVSVSDRRESVVCPKPRRVGVLSNNPFRPQISHRSEICKSKAAAELLDLILKKEDYELEPQSPMAIASTPPFFAGSPPRRAENPLVQDARFRDEKITPIMALPAMSPSGLPSPSASARKGCARMKFGLKPAAVRVEGFDCLNRDSKNSSIPAVA